MIHSDELDTDRASRSSARAAAALTVALVLTGCADSLPVQVAAFRDPASQVSGMTPICFLPASLPPGAPSPLEATRVHSLMSASCARAAVEIGVPVVPYGGACHPVSLEVNVGQPRTASQGGMTTCFPVGMGMMTCEADNGSAYEKSLRLRVFDRGSATPRMLHQVNAVVTGAAPNFKEATATALCRAAFRDYPQEIFGVTSYVDPEW